MKNYQAPEISWTRINNDVNGNPRYVCHFFALLTPAEKENCDTDRYTIALLRAKKIGGKKYRNKQYCGGIVFQSYCLGETEEAIKRVLSKV